MKKLFVALLLALLTLSCICAAAESHTCSGGTATCDALAVCATCGKTYGRLADHAWGAWVSDNDATHTRTCRTNAGHTETRYHMGGGSTCTEGAKCVMCGAVHDAPLGHVPENYPGYAPTCISNGATDGEKCSRCGATTTPRRVIPATGHSFNLWTPLAGSIHTAVCTTPGCGTSTVVPCTPFELTVNGKVAAICPICGMFDDVAFPMLTAEPCDALPMGQLLVRGAAAPFDGCLYAFTVTGSYAGKVIEPESDVKVYLPENLAAYPAFELVRVDMVPVAEDEAATEVRTTVPFRLVDGNLSFTTDAAGLFLLVPAE